MFSQALTERWRGHARAVSRAPAYVRAMRAIAGSLEAPRGMWEAEPARRAIAAAADPAHTDRLDDIPQGG